MATNLYPIPTEDTLLEWANEVTRIRGQDTTEFDELDDRFMAGRYRFDRAAPTSATNVLAGDAMNDFLWDDNYYYILIDATAGLRWARITHTISW